MKGDRTQKTEYKHQKETVFFYYDLMWRSMITLPVEKALDVNDDEITNKRLKLKFHLSETERNSLTGGCSLPCSCFCTCRDKRQDDGAVL